MNIKDAYNIWSSIYDSNENKTRDLEARSLRETLEGLKFDNCLELGCGTGKNTEWLVTKARQITSVDFSSEMLVKAKEKIKSPKVDFVELDISKDWTFKHGPFDMIIFSLVLEHIEDIDSLLEKASQVMIPGGHLYIGELHPFKQYSGSKAKFDSNRGEEILTCYTHNISDFTQAGKKYNFEIVTVNEYFDDNNSITIPRILTILFKKR